jgi:hypothetical protein
MQFIFGKGGISTSALAGAFCLLLFAVAAEQPMGSSPEASFAGTWRVIAARVAPWVKPHELQKREAPLLEYAFIFANGEVKGPPPLGCRHAP